jgi:predicted nuclease of restriction endonuclease-like (RecB) superfamily
LSLYWELGKAITSKQGESEWGDKIITQLSKDLTGEFPQIKGFSVTNLKYIRKWYGFYRPIGQQAVDQLNKPDTLHPSEKGQQPVDQITGNLENDFPTVLSLVPWGHHIQIFTKSGSLQEALFYVQRTAASHWSRNVLVHQMESGLYSRKGQALTNFDVALPRYQSDLANELLKNPYNFDFLTLGPQSIERDLENALIANIKKFLLEMGSGFAFVGQQYHLSVGENDYYLDLLFYHTRLHCYVVVELKISEFIPEFAGKLDFYLTVVDEQLKSDVDNPSIGLLLLHACCQPSHRSWACPATATGPTRCKSSLPVKSNPWDLALTLKVKGCCLMYDLSNAL